MKGCIYLIKNILNGKCYIGQTSTLDINKRYKAHWRCALKNSSYIIHRAMRKHGKEAFIIDCLCIVPNESLNRMEAYYAEQYESYIWDNPGGYNMIWCGGSSNARLGLKMPENVKNALRKSRIGSKHTEESKQLMSKALTGRILSQESIKKSALSRTGSKLSEETKTKIREKAKNRIISEEQRAKISKALTGRKGHSHSEETKKRMSERMKGNIFTDETRDKISKTKLSQNLKNLNKLKYGSSILTEEQCIEIKKLKGLFTCSELGVKYGVSRAHIHNIQTHLSPNTDFHSPVRVP
jgi:group I intron endonuclease